MASDLMTASDTSTSPTPLLTKEGNFFGLNLLQYLGLDPSAVALGLSIAEWLRMISGNIFAGTTGVANRERLGFQ